MIFNTEPLRTFQPNAMTTVMLLPLLCYFHCYVIYVILSNILIKRKNTPSKEITFATLRKTLLFKYMENFTTEN